MIEHGNQPAPPKPPDEVPGGGGVQVHVKPSTNPCEPLRLAWLRAQRACDEAAERAKKAEARKKRAQAELDRLEHEFPDLGGHDEGANVDGETYTFNDLRMLQRLANKAFARYTANPSPETAREAQDAAQQALTPEMRERLRNEQAEAEARKQQLRDEIGECQAIIDEAKRLCEIARQLEAAYRQCIGARSVPQIARPTAGPPPPEPAPPEATPPEPKPPKAADDPRDTHDGDDPRDTSPCPPGSEKWHRCNGKVEYFDWQRDDALVRFEMRPAVNSAYGWLQSWNGDYTEYEGVQSFDCQVPQRALEHDLSPASSVRTAQSMFRDLNAEGMLNKTWIVSIRATFTYVRSGWACERRCQNGVWTFRAAEVGRREMTRVIEPATVLNSTNPQENINAIAKMLATIGEFAHALFVDYLNVESYQVSCRQGVVCAGKWERSGPDDVKRR